MREGAADSRAFSKPSNVIDKLVGPANESPIKVNGVSATALLDSGSQVSTVSLTFLQKFLSEVTVKPLNHLLRVEVAGGATLSYLGYVEVELELPGKLSGPDCSSFPALLLVVPSTSYNSGIPVLLGTNVLYSCKSMASGNRKIPSAWSNVFKLMHLQQQVEVEGIPVHISSSVEVPTGESVMVGVETNLSSVTVGGKSVCLEADGNMSLPSGVLMTPLWLDNDSISPNLTVELRNISDKNVTIPANTEVCRAFPVTEVSPSESDCSKVQLQQTTSDISDDEFLNMFDLKHLDFDIRQKTMDLLVKWKHVFSLNDSDLGLVKGYTHSIDLTDDSPFKCRRTHVPHYMVEEVREHLLRMHRSGVIQPSHSQYASPLVLVKKPDSSLRFCVDFRTLNSRSKRDQFEIPSVDSTLDRLAGSKYFSSLDVRSGYWQIPLNPADRDKTAFTAGSLGFWEYLRMPMGLTNACSSFQRMMEMVMGSLNLEACLLYLDDIVIFSDTIDGHLEKLSRVLERIAEYGLKLKPSKCNFFREKLKYLGFIVSENGVEADPDKIQSVVNWPVPSNFVQLRRFLGFAGYFRKFIKSFAQIAKPLHSLLKGSLLKRGKINPKIKFEWLEIHQKSFDCLIECLTNTPVLAFADFTKPFEVETDASSSGLGAVLFQKYLGEKRVVAFASRSLSSSESKYPAHKLECLALKWAVCEKFRDYLYGAPSFVVVTDNNPLTYLLSTAKLDAMSHRWVAELSQFNFSIRYRSGHKNVAADALSRVNEVKSLSEEAVKAIIDLKDVDELVSCISLSHALPELPSFDGLFDPPVGTLTFEDWSVLQHEDSHISCVIDGLQSDISILSDDSEETQLLWKERRRLFLHENVLFRKRMVFGVDHFQLVLPLSKRRMVFDLAHGNMGHLGRDRVMEILRDRFYWPRMSSNVESWIKSCDRCLRRNKSRVTDRALLHPITSSQPMEIVCMDYLGLETSVGGYNSILVLTDHFTRFAMAVPTKNQTALTTARCLIDLFIQHYGLPLRLHSDKGSAFESKVIAELCQLLGIERSSTTPYHPMGNGQCERMNRTLLSMLGTLPEEKKSRWKEYVLPMVHAYNCTKHDSTGFAPFELMFGRKPRLPIDLVLGLNHPRSSSSSSYSEYVAQLEQRLKEAYIKAGRNVAGSINKMLGRYNAHTRGRQLESGDRVLVKKVRFGEGKHKLQDFWEEDVYVVLDCHPDVPVYSVKKERGSGKIKKLHRNLLLPIEGNPEEIDDAQISDSENEFQDVEELYSDGYDHSCVQPENMKETEDRDDLVPQRKRQSDETEDRLNAPEKVHSSAPSDQAQASASLDQPKTSTPSDRSDSVKPIPLPRRSNRQRKPPSWITSGEYVTNFQHSAPSEKEKLDFANSLLLFLR